MATAADVPGKYDVVINGKGYTFLRTLDGSYLSANRHRAEYAYTPHFITRQNVSDAFGDNAQDFFLTVAQTDWSLGSQQNFLNMNDADSMRKYNSGSSIDCSNPGYFLPMNDATLSDQTLGTQAVCTGGETIGANVHYAALTATLQSLTEAGVRINFGTSGAGTVARWGMCSDGKYIYMAGATAFRKWDGTTFSNFSATTNVGAIAFLNNQLYSCDGSVLNSWSAAGAATAVFTWKDATGTALTPFARKPKLIPFGGNLLIFFDTFNSRGALWQYDGTGTKVIAELPKGVTGWDAIVVNGVVYMTASDGNLWYYTGSTLSKVNITNGTPNCGIGVYQGNLIFGGTRYNSSTGAIDSPPVSGDWMTSSANAVIGWFNSAVKARVWPTASLYPASVTIFLSDIDLGNTLIKEWRSIKIDWEAVGGGLFDAGPTVDVQVYVDDFNHALPPAGSFTGVSTGVQNVFPSGKLGVLASVSITINTSSPKTAHIKKIYLRAAPVLQVYRVRTYNLDLSSTVEHPTALEDGSFQPLSGYEQAQNLKTAIEAGASFSVTDRLGTYQGICQPENCVIQEIHSQGTSPAKSGQFIAQIQVREV